MSDKVVNIFDKRKEREDEAVSAVEEDSPEASFEAIAKANAARKEKLARERADANKSVLRSYRIKN